MKVIPGSTYSGYQEIIAYSEADREPAVSEFYLMRKCNAPGNKSHIKGMHGDDVRSRTKKIAVESSKSLMPIQLIRSVPLYPIAFTNICKDKNIYTFTYNGIRMDNLHANEII